MLGLTRTARTLEGVFLCGVELFRTFLNGALVARLTRNDITTLMGRGPVSGKSVLDTDRPSMLSKMIQNKKCHPCYFSLDTSVAL